jgi:hypothetical protein
VIPVDECLGDFVSIEDLTYSECGHSPSCRRITWSLIAPSSASRDVLLRMIDRIASPSNGRYPWHIGAPSHPARCIGTGHSVPSKCSPSRGESCIAVVSLGSSETDRSGAGVSSAGTHCAIRASRRSAFQSRYALAGCAFIPHLAKSYFHADELRLTSIAHWLNSLSGYCNVSLGSC